MSKKAVVIGAGFAGLSTASLLQKKGWDVTVWERNSGVGGRARLWESDGYSFDMGPSWYLMPEVFDRFFAHFGRTAAESYSLTKLRKQYKVFFEGLPSETISDDLEETKALFERFEAGGARKLTRFLAEAKFKYDTAMSGFLEKDYKSLTDFFNWTILTKGPGLGLFSSLDSFVSKNFKDRRSRQILEYAMVFLGSSPSNAPSLYSLLSHVDLNLGVWFPAGGMNGVAQALARLLEEHGGKIELNKD
ncbi:MAG: phytoene desaturase, partial [Spirochaetales bacterium]|nr:phytoene desaturase [Spirochaetales bacterium]